MFDSILVVCTGNICRSPIGERLLRRMLPGKKIGSAGTGALVGHSADDKAIKIAEFKNLMLDGHEGRQLTSTLGREYDLILVMERKHIEQVDRILPGSRGKTMMFSHWTGQRDIPDPYRKSDEAFCSVYELIEKAAELWAEKLRS